MYAPRIPEPGYERWNNMKTYTGCPIDGSSCTRYNLHADTHDVHNCYARYLDLATLDDDGGVLTFAEWFTANDDADTLSHVETTTRAPFVVSTPPKGTMLHSTVAVEAADVRAVDTVEFSADRHAIMVRGLGGQVNLVGTPDDLLTLVRCIEAAYDSIERATLYSTPRGTR